MYKEKYRQQKEESKALRKKIEETNLVNNALVTALVDELQRTNEMLQQALAESPPLDMDTE